MHNPLVDWNDCVGGCVLLINIAIKYRSSNGLGGCLRGMSQSYLQTCRHVCCILIMLKPLYKSSDATEEVSALTEEMASTNS